MIIFRYLSREVIVTALAVSSVLLLIIMSGRFVNYLADAAAGDLAVNVLFIIMGYRLPGFMELILPLGFFIAILLAYGRLYTDSEMVVLSACGISPRQLVGITMIPALALAAVIGALSLWVSPMGVRATETVLAEQRTRSEFDVIQPGRFQPMGGDSMAYTSGVSEDRQQLESIFVAQGGRQAGTTRHSVLVADYAEQTTRSELGHRYLNLHSGRRYEGQPGEADYEVTQFETFAQYIEPPDLSVAFRNKSDAWPTRDLIGADDVESQVTLQWRISLPILVLVVAFMAVPLSRTDPRRGRYVKMLPAIILYMLYLGALSSLRGAIEAGRWPIAPGLWVVHPIFIGIGVLMLNWNNLMLWQRRRKAEEVSRG